MEYTENIDREWSIDPDPNGLKLALELREVDPQALIGALKNLSDSGSSLAMLYIGDAYANGRGLDRDVNIGIDWYRRAANQGSIEAAHRLAFCYYHRNKFEDSAEILRELSEKEFSPSTYCLGLYHLYGVGVEKSPDLAMKFWELAERQGNLLATRKISFFLRSGERGFLGRIRGIVKMFFLIIPYVRCGVRNPRSDRLREW